jgi:WD40 repeat protein
MSRGGSNIADLAFSGSSQETLALVGRDGALGLWSTSLQPIVFLTGHQGLVRSIAFRADGTLESCGADGKVISWDTAAHPGLAKVIIDSGSINDIAYSPDGKKLAAGTGRGVIKVFDLARGLGNDVNFGTDEDFIKVAYGPKGVWGQHVESRYPYGDGLAVSPDGKTLAFANLGSVRIENTEGEILHEIRTGKSDLIRGLAFRPEGRALAVLTDDTLELWDLKTLQKFSQRERKGAFGLGLAFSKDGKILAAAGAAGSVSLWDAQTLKSLGPALEGHTGIVTDLAFSPEDNLLASGSADHTIRLWDVAARQSIGPPLTVGDPVAGVAFSPDGKTLASAGTRTILLWDIDFASWQERACRIANRNLTREEWKQYIGADPYRKTCPNFP